MKKILFITSLTALLIGQNSFAASACSGVSENTGNAYDLQITKADENLTVLVSQNGQLFYEGPVFRFQTSLFVGADGMKHESTTYWNRRVGQQGGVDVKVKTIDQNILQMQLVSPEVVNLKCLIVNY